MTLKNIIHYILLAALIFIGIVSLINLAKVQTELTASKAQIDSTLQIVKASQEIISRQAKTIGDMQKLNEDLRVKVNKADSVNRLIKRTIDSKFISTNKSLNELKKDIENIQIPVIH
jgi:predicted Holliday junction resolvase-like endonuclease